MTEPGSPPVQDMLASFFKRLETIEEVSRIILDHSEISALLTFRGEPEKRVLLDYSRAPCRIIVDDELQDGNILVTIEGEIMHEILTGKIKPGLALGRRELLLRGSALNLGKFIPLLDFGPLLYKEHLSDMRFSGFARRSGYSPLKETAMNQEQFKGDPIPLTKLSFFEKTIFKMIDRFAYVIGYVLGKLRYGALEKMSLFGVISAMSDGIEAAAPKNESEKSS